VLGCTVTNDQIVPIAASRSPVRKLLKNHAQSIRAFHMDAATNATKSTPTCSPSFKEADRDRVIYASSGQKIKDKLPSVPKNTGRRGLCKTLSLMCGLLYAGRPLSARAAFCSFKDEFTHYRACRIGTAFCHDMIINCIARRTGWRVISIN